MIEELTIRLNWYVIYIFMSIGVNENEIIDSSYGLYYYRYWILFSISKRFGWSKFRKLKYISSFTLYIKYYELSLCKIRVWVSLKQSLSWVTMLRSRESGIEMSHRIVRKRKLWSVWREINGVLHIPCRKNLKTP